MLLTPTRSPVKKAVLITGAVLTSGVLAALLAGSLLIAPHRSHVELPTGFAGTEVSFASDSGATLKGNLLKGTAGKGALVLMHGVRANRGEMVRRAQFLHRAGYSVLIFDFQAHGESSGSKITSGYLESMDARSAVAFLRSKLPGEKIGVLGVSLGGVAVILAEPPLEVNAAVLELAYADLDLAVKNRIAIVLGDWARPLSFMLTAQLKPRLGVGLDRFNCVERIAKLSCPKLIVTGANDRHTRLSDSKALFAAAREPKELWVVDNAAHQDLHAVEGEVYEKRILQFFDANLQGSRNAAR